MIIFSKIFPFYIKITLVNKHGYMQYLKNVKTKHREIIGEIYIANK